MTAAMINGLMAQQPASLPEVRVSAKPYKPADLTLRVQSDLVEVSVVVKDRAGQVVSGLNKDDFSISDQGARRQIASFVVDSASAAATASSSKTNAMPLPNSSAPTLATAQRSVALHFDDYGTNPAELQQAQVAAKRFVNSGLAPNDLAAMFATSGDSVGFTADRAKLIAAIDKLRAHPKFSEGGQSSCPRIAPYQAYLITEEHDPDALNAAKEEAKTCSGAPPPDPPSPPSGPKAPKPLVDLDTQTILGQAEQTWGQARIASQNILDSLGNTITALSKRPGKRVLLLVSSGFISGTLEREKDALVNRCLRSGIVINAMDAKGLVAEAPARPFNEPSQTTSTANASFRFEAASLGSRIALANAAMSDFAEGTGGIFFHNNNDLNAGFEMLGQTPATTYLLGFHQDDSASDGKYHKLKVAFTSSKPYSIEARPGYFADKKAQPTVTFGELIDKEINSQAMNQPFLATVTCQLAPKSPDLTTVKITFVVDLHKIKFATREDRQVQQLRLVAVLQDAKGNVVTGKEGLMDLALTEPTYKRLSESGIKAMLNLDVPPGQYRLRGVVLESAEGHVASTTQQIEIH